MKNNNLFFLALIIIISSVGILSLLRPGFFLTDDGNSMVIRFSAFYETLKSGQFPVRFLSRLNYGFGYPVADFLYPLFMYIGVPIHILKFSFVDTIKIILGISMIGSAIFTYFWLSKLFDKFSSFTGAVFYFYTPYHLYDIYIRGSVGEVLSLAIAPFIFWQLERQSIFWSAIGIGSLIIAHNSLAILFLFLIIPYMVLDIFIVKNKKNMFYKYIAILLFGLGLSSFFWLPAIFDLQYTVFSKTQVSDWRNYFSNVNLIGVSTIIVISLTLIFMFTKKIEIKKHRLTVLLFTLGVISIFFATSPSTFLWNLLPVSFVQFPFRLLSIAILCASFLAACITSVLKGQVKVAVGISLLVLALFSSSQFLFPKVFQQLPDTFYSTNQESTTVKNEYMPKWVKNIPTEMASSKVVNLKGEEKINTKEITANKIAFDVYLPIQRTIQVNTVYFPGWNVYVNGRKSNIIYDDGLINFNLNKGENRVLVKFEETPIRELANLISMVSLIVLLAFLINEKKVFKI